MSLAKLFVCALRVLLPATAVALQSSGSVNPGFAAFEYYFCGVAKASEGDLRGAIAEFDRLIQLNPKDEIAYYNRGLVEANKGDFDTAMADFNHAIQLRPTFARAYNDRGSVRATKGDIDGAISDFNCAIRVSPQFFEAYLNLGSAKANRGDLDGAIADFNIAVRLDPDSVQGLQNLGSAKARKNDFEGAIADYNRALQLDPNDFGALEMRALTKQLKGDFEGALGDLALFSELSPPGESQDYAQLYTWLLRVRRGDSTDANRELAAYLGSGHNMRTRDWTAQIGRFLLDQISESDFLDGATSPDTEQDRAQHCEAWYYAGVKRLMAGDKKTAADYFNKCVGTQEKNLYEYILAQAELKSVGASN